MSEISVLSNQYERLVKISDRINNSVITIKKRDLISNLANKKLYPNVFIEQEDLQQSVNILANFLQNLNKLLNEETSKSEDLPLIILDDYKTKLGETPYFKEDLAELIANIEEGNALDEKDIKILNRVLSVLDSERTLLFRKMRTGRG